MKRPIQKTVLFLLTAGSLHLNAQTFPSGLVSWWKGESNIVDSVGTNNGAIDVPLVTLSYVPGQDGQAFEFSGGFVQVPDSADLRPLTNLTVQAWVRSVLPGLFTYVISKSQSVGGAATSSYGFECGANNGNLLFYVYDGTNRIQAPAPTAGVPWDGNWHMATGTYDGSAVRLYLDGVEIGSGTAATNNIDYSNPGQLVFGDFGVPGGSGYYGDLDEVKVFTNAMSASDVFNTYLDPNDPAGTNGLVGWWRAEGNPKDSTGNHNGTDGVIPPKPFEFVSGGVRGLAMFPHGGGTASVPDSDSLRPANLTFQVWVKSLSPGTYRYVANKGEATAAISWGLYTDGSGGLFFLIHNGTTYILSPGAPSTMWDGHWHMATGTYDGSMVRLYVDGVQIGAGSSDPAGHINYTTPKALYIGDYQTGGGGNFSGEIDEMQIYNRALSDSEILALYTSYASGPVSWWQAADNANDTLGPNNGVLAGSVTYGSDKLGSGSAFKTQGGSVQIADSTTLHLTNVAVHAFVRALSPGNDKYIISKSYTAASASYAFSTGPGGGLVFYVTAGAGKMISPAATSAIWDGLYHMVDGIYDGQKVRLFVDGAELAPGTPATGSILYGTSQSAGKLLFGDFSDVPAGANFPGYIDEVKIYGDVALALQRMPGDFDAASPPMMFFAQPASVKANPGDNVTFSVSVLSPVALKYQWRFNGTNVPGATSSSLTVSNVHSASAGSYSVAVSAPGLTYTTGAVGQAFAVGNGGMLRVPLYPPFATDNFTVQLWARSTPPGAYRYLLSKSRDPLVYSSSYALYTAGGGDLTWAVALTNADEPTYHVSYFTTSAGTAPWDNNWHQITGTWDGEFLALYTDGALVQSVDTGGPTNIFYRTDFLDGDVLLGDVLAPTSPYHFTGSLDEMKFFDHALTADDVMNCYTNGAAATNGLVGWWQGENNFLDSVGPNYAMPLPPSGTTVSASAVLTLNFPVFVNTKVNGGIFQTTLSGPTGGSYIIQSSPDLVTWVSITTNTVPFVVSAPASGKKFYRAVANLP